MTTDPARLPLTQMTFASPVPESARWLAGVEFPPDRPLINVAQAAPMAPPPEGLRRAMAEALEDPATHRYAPDLGLPPLRAAFAEHWGRLYGGLVTASQVTVTSGANHAFCAAIAALCASGDAVMLPVPWYFNHKMWLDMAGVETVPLPTGADLLPDPEAARARITPRTRAIVLVTPNNPAGIDYPADLIGAFFDLARETGLRLILDETYRDFHGGPGTPHDLLSRPDWDETVVQLYSFSKSFRMAGHRIGAMVGAPGLMPEVEKFIDTVTICATPLSQRAALWGLANLGQWLEEQRSDLAARRAHLKTAFAPLAERGWHLRGLGGYFAYVEHPFALNTQDMSRRLVREAGILALPGAMFAPPGTPQAARHLRVACANIDAGQIDALVARLAALPWPLAP